VIIRKCASARDIKRDMVITSGCANRPGSDRKSLPRSNGQAAAARRDDYRLIENVRGEANRACGVVPIDEDR
jgi:hypothetical protein